MNSLQWINLYDAFKKFDYLAGKLGLFARWREEIELYLWERCPMPKKWQADCKR